MNGPSRSIFRFKQFEVDQTGCAMKINTDGVLLGVLTQATNPASILDIGTGTGVIALMLAQRYAEAIIDAVEIDVAAANTAGQNFSASPFAGRLSAHNIDFVDFLANNPIKRYDLIVSNPPFYIDSLVSPGEKKNLAKHAGDNFFNDLITNLVRHLTEQGVVSLILPINTAELVRSIAAQHNLFVKETIAIHSFATDAPHREILTFGRQATPVANQKFIIYDAPKIYSEQYRQALANFFIVF